MPKRVATPPPPDDEPRYVIVVHPYPLHANLQQHEDRRTLALWLACCTGKDVLLAMFHKPTSPGMVIIEVDRDFDRFKSLLGMHAWSDFLLKPTREEEGKSSKVFWCTYNTGRLVEKNGWKRVYIEEHWFANWSPHNTRIKYPYPMTTYCDLPSEAKTGVPLCRPLPQAFFPKPAPQTKPPVGSSEWISARGSDVASDITPSSRKKRGQKPPPAAPCLRSPSIAPIGSTSASRAPILIGSPTYPARRSAPVPPGLTRPPGLTNKQFYRHVDWGDEAECLEADQDGVPTPASAAGAGVSTSLSPDRYNAPPRHVPDPEGPVEADRTYHYYDEDIPKRTTKDAMTDLFDSAPRSSARWGDEEDDEDPAAYPTRDQPPHNYGEAVGDLNPWIEYKTPKWELPTKINRVGDEDWECPDHGPMCNPGICKERARVELERRWAKEREERAEKKRKWFEKKANDVKKKERRLARDEADEAVEVPRDQRSNGRSRGSSDSTSSGSSSGNTSESEEDGSHDRGSRVHVESPERSLPPASPTPEDRNVTDTDEDEEGDMRSVTGAWTTSTSANSQTDMSEVSRSSASNRQSPCNARGTVSSRSQRSTRSPSSQSPALGQRQPAWDARSTASSRTTASSIRNEQPTRGNATTKPKSLSGQCPPDWDTRSEQSSVSSAAGSRRPVSGTRNPVGAHNTASPIPDTPAEGGFPTYSNTQWGDPIAYRLAHRRKSSASTGVGDAEEDGVGDTVEAGKQGSERSSSGSGRSGRGRWARRKVDPEARKGVGSSQATLPSILDVKLPPGGPGESWGDPNFVW